MTQPISEILRRGRHLSRQDKIHYLRGHIACEKKNSIRWKELVAALKPILNHQIKSEVRDEKKGRAA